MTTNTATAQAAQLVVMIARPARGSGVTKRGIAHAAHQLTGVPVARIDVEYLDMHEHDGEARRRNLSWWEPGATGRCYLGGTNRAAEMSELLYG